MTWKSLLSALAKDMAGVNTLGNSCLLYNLQGSGVSMDVRKHCPGHGFGRGNFYLQNHGFTLIELLVTLAVVSIVALTAFPNLSALIAQNQSAILTNTLSGSLAYARSEAVTKHTSILTCQSNNGSECSSSNTWHNGWIVFEDKNSNKQRDLSETLLRVYSAVENDTQIIFRGSGRGTKYYMKYKPSGAASPNGSFLICNPNIGVGKALIMTHSGRLRLSKVQTNGSAVTCN